MEFYANMNNKNKKLDEIKIKGYYDTWSEINRVTVPNDLDGETTYHLMENDEWGDETCYLVINDDQTEIYETFDGILTCLVDEGIIDNEEEYWDKVIEESFKNDEKLEEKFTLGEYTIQNAKVRNPYNYTI